jgi:adenosine deaminase
MSPAAAARIARLPKAELHVHVEGTVSATLARTLASRNGVALPADLFDDEGRYRWVDFRTFVTRTYPAVAAVVRTADDYHDVVYDYLARLSAENALYAEIAIAPRLAERVHGLAVREGLAGMTDAIDAARADFGIEARLLPTVIRHEAPSLGRAEIGYFVEHPHPYVTGVNIAGAELPGDIARHREAFELAARAGLRATAHAGEALGPNAIRDVLAAVPTLERIGHGVRAVEDPALVAELAARELVLEVCPSSNLCLGIYEDFAAHPLKRLLEAGVRVTLNSDDPPFFRTSLGREYLLAHTELGLGEDDLLACTRRALHAAFVDDDTRATLLARLERSPAQGAQTPAAIASLHQAHRPPSGGAPS